jgi:hypothetical protein
MAGLLPASYRRLQPTVILHPARRSLPPRYPIYPTRTVPLNQYSPEFRASQERLCRATNLNVLRIGCLFQVIVRLGLNEHRSSPEIALAFLDISKLFDCAESRSCSGCAGYSDPAALLGPTLEDLTRNRRRETRLPSGFDENKLGNGSTQADAGSRTKVIGASVLECAGCWRSYPYAD